MIDSFKKINFPGEAGPIIIGLIVIFPDDLDGNVNRSKEMTSKVNSGEAATAEDGFTEIGFVDGVHSREKGRK
jgi:hypothetical protein